jgi:hypothetical protein
MQSTSRPEPCDSHVVALSHLVTPFFVEQEILLR